MSHKPQRSWLSWLTVLALLAGVACLLPGCAAAKQPPAPVVFRAMSFNIHHGEGLDGKVDLERIARCILDQKADLVAVQEVDKGVRRTQGRDFPSELARLTGMTCVFSNNYAFQGGEYGNAILSRFPILSATNLHYRMLRAGEQRGLLQTQVQVGGHRLWFLATHIDYRPDDAERLANVAEMAKCPAVTSGGPFLIAGDFNDQPGSRTHAGMLAFAQDAWLVAGQGDGFTIPANSPRSRIDYLWLPRGPRLTVKRIWVVPSDASDHLPLVGEFELR